MNKDLQDIIEEGWEPDVYIHIKPEDLENMGYVTDDQTGKTEYIFKHIRYDKWYRTRNGVLYTLSKNGRYSSKTNLTINDLKNIMENKMKAENITEGIMGKFPKGKDWEMNKFDTTINDGDEAELVSLINNNLGGVQFYVKHIPTKEVYFYRYQNEEDCKANGWGWVLQSNNKADDMEPDNTMKNPADKAQDGQNKQNSTPNNNIEYFTHNNKRTYTMERKYKDSSTLIKEEFKKGKVNNITEACDSMINLLDNEIIGNFSEAFDYMYDIKQYFNDDEKFENFIEKFGKFSSDTDENRLMDIRKEWIEYSDTLIETKLNESDEENLLESVPINLNDNDIINYINDSIKLPLNKIRKLQDLNNRQMQKAYKDRNTVGLKNLQVMELVYQAIVDIKEFGSTIVDWLPSIKQLMNESEKNKDRNNKIEEDWRPRNFISYTIEDLPDEIYNYLYDLNFRTRDFDKEVVSFIIKPSLDIEVSKKDGTVIGIIEPDESVYVMLKNMFKNQEGVNDKDMSNNKIEEKKEEYEFEKANLYFKGIAMDKNGNKVAKFYFPNQSAFSIQTNGNLPSLHKLSKGDMMTKDMEKEVIDYIKNYGSSKQKNSLKVVKESKENIKEDMSMETGYIFSLIENDQTFYAYFNSDPSVGLYLDWDWYLEREIKDFSRIVLPFTDRKEAISIFHDMKKDEPEAIVSLEEVRFKYEYDPEYGEGMIMVNSLRDLKNRKLLMIENKDKDINDTKIEENNNYDWNVIIESINGKITKIIKEENKVKFTKDNQDYILQIDEGKINIYIEKINVISEIELSENMDEIEIAQSLNESCNNNIVYESNIDKVKEAVDIKKVIKDLQGNFGSDNEAQMKGVQLLKGLATSDDPLSNKFMKKLDTATTKISKEVLGE